MPKKRTSATPSGRKGTAAGGTSSSTEKMKYVPPPSSAAAPVVQSHTGKGKLRYVPPPTTTTAPTPQSSPGQMKMRYVPPPTNAGAWTRPKKDASSNSSQWEESAKTHEQERKLSAKVERFEAKQQNSVGMSGNDRADLAATKVEFDLWTKKDVSTALAWARAEECRIPNKRVAKGGRLHKLMNILLNNCDYVNERINQEKRYQNACRDPTQVTGLDLRRQFVAPLAKRVLNKVEDEEIEAAFRADDPDSDDSEGMAM